MPGRARSTPPAFPRLYGPAAAASPETLTMPFQAAPPTPKERDFLLELQHQALHYFLENQTPGGLILDRQHNHGPRRPHGLCSTAATGMGLMALALASAPPYRLLTPGAAAQRVRAALGMALDQLPTDHGMLPHFTDSATAAVFGGDPISTLDSSWLLAGALWAAALLEDADLEVLALRLYERVDWQYWTVPEGRVDEEAGRPSPPPGLLRHGKGPNGEFLACGWDRLNGETAFMYVLGAGAADGRAVSGNVWSALQPFYGTVAGYRFNNADLGLFVFQYSLELLDLQCWRSPGAVDLEAEATIATTANYHACRQAADRFTTYRYYWGLSAGDGPGRPPEPDAYRCYSPIAVMDGTAHLTAALAAVAHGPGPVLENLFRAENYPGMRVRGRYGFSNVNLDRHWVGRDVVGIDIGAAILAVDNYLMNERVRRVFHGLPCVRRGLERLGFRHSSGAEVLRQAS
jgi:hypothetical protein